MVRYTKTHPDLVFMNTAAGPKLSADAVVYHRELAQGWEGRYRKKSFRARQQALGECLSGCALAGTKWIDAGCGTGTLSRWLASQGCQVTGVDAASDMIEVAVDLTRRARPALPVEFTRVATIAHLPFHDAAVDGVLCSSVLEYVDDPGRCLQEFARVLRPGGWLVVSVPNAASLIRRGQVAAHRAGRFLGCGWLRFLDYSRHEYTSREFRQMLDAHGFAAERALSLGSPIPRWLQRRAWAGSLLMFRAIRRQAGITVHNA
jgi:2-polyprenyl-6-hydroxyphenyl methylase/3-demethylubiquinone-9 3-methyltransferase